MKTRKIVTVCIMVMTVVACSNSLPSESISISTGDSHPTQSQLLTPVPTNLSVHLSPVVFFENLPTGFCVSESQINGSATFRFPGIFAIDKNTVFIFGILTLPEDGEMRSLLLRSDNGGKDWREAMQPVLHHALLNVSFVDPKEGWALAVYAMESPGDIILFKSLDGGKKWKELTTISVGLLGHGVGTPVAMLFQDKLNGKIVIGFEQYYSVLSTNDGGITWQETEQLPSPISIDLDTTKSRGLDWSEWSIETAENSISHTIQISYQLPGKSIEIAGYLPESYKVANGCLTQQ